MNKFVIFLFIVFAGILGYLSYLNKETVIVKLGPNSVYEVSEIALILISSTAGAFALFLVVALRDVRRYIENWQNLKQQKRHARLQEIYARGMQHLLAMRYNEAKEGFSRVLDDEPSHVDSLIRLGDIALKQGATEMAVSYHKKAKETAPRNVEVLFSLAGDYEEAGRYQEALGNLDRILEIDGNNLYALYRKRQILEKNERWEDIIAIQHRIIKSGLPLAEKNKEQKEFVGYEYEYGRHNLESGRFEQAKKAFRTALRLDRNFVPAYLGLAEVYLREGDTEEGISILLKGIEQTSSLIPLIRLEDLFIGIGEPGRIIELYQKAVAANPKDPGPQFFLGKLYYRLEMIDDAYDVLSAIDTGGIIYPALHKLIGNIYLRWNQVSRAAEEFKKALGFRKIVVVPYCCSRCGFKTKNWFGRCPQCRSWGTFTFDFDGTCKA